jgi:hypothetical protein
MTTPVKLSEAGKRGLAALGRVARTIPTRAPAVEVRLGTSSPAVADGEVLVLVMCKTGALVGKTEVSGDPDLGSLRALFIGAEVAADRLARAAPAQLPALSSSESATLDKAGLVESARASDPLERTRIELELFLRESLSLTQAAHALRVSTGRLRQRLSPEVRTLYGVKVGRAWRVPRFQLGKRGALVRNLEKVLPHVSRSAHPLAVQRWFTSPHQDLVFAGDEQAVSPVGWLEAGLDPGVVAELASEI